MPSVNKQSLREEFDHIKVKFKNLSDEGKISPETTSLFQSLFMLFELLIAAFMEKKTLKNNRNSSIPSSQTGKDSTSTGTNGKGNKQNGALFENTHTVETIQVAKVKDCEFCGEALHDTPVSKHERRTKIDIVFEKVVNHVDAEIKVCPRCKMENKGCFPKDMSGPLQYGSGIKGYVVNLLVAQMASLKRIQQMIQTLIGQIISEATILKYVIQLYHIGKRQEKMLSEQEFKKLQKRYRIILSDGEKELPPIPEKQNGKRGKIAKSDARNLWERLKKYESAVLLFAKLPHVPFTNNRAECDLRMNKVKQKVSGCFRMSLYAKAYCRISSYLQTMANKGHNPLVAIQMAFSEQIYTDRGE